LFAALVDASKLERAYDLVNRLHLEKSFEIAMTIANRHRTLVDMIEEAMDRRFGAPEDGGGDGGDDDDDDSSIGRAHTRVSPEANPPRNKRPSDSLFSARVVRGRSS
jgi:hypothetical protein